MKQEYFVLVLAHSLKGRLRRIHIPHTAVYAVLALACFGCFSVFGFVASYARMAWKVANYNALKQEADSLRARYQNLQNEVRQTDAQMASLQLYAKEVTAALDIKQKMAGPSDIAAEGKLVPSFAESLADYQYLQSVDKLTLRSRFSNRVMPVKAQPPSLWPLEGRLLSGFAQRIDPFSGEGAFHTGVDIQASMGAPVHATADGIVISADMFGGYGRLIRIDHGGGIETYYAHLSKINVHVGQDVRRGEVVGLVGSSGRTTAPHLHYEVRIGGAPVNPYRYLAQSGVYRAPVKDFPF